MAARGNPSRRPVRRRRDRRPPGGGDSARHKFVVEGSDCREFDTVYHYWLTLGSDDRVHPFLGTTMHGDERWICGEPSLDEMLADPIVRILMERDGLSEQSVRGVFEDAAKRLKAHAASVTRAA